MGAPEMIRSKGDGIDIQLAVWEGREPAILCVHGLTANCRCWDTLAGNLAPTHQVIAVDLRGRGLSDKPDTGYSIAHHVQDLTRVLDDLDLQHVVLMGHSLGGYIALALAAKQPERVSGLIMIDAGGDLTNEQWDGIDDAIRPAVDRLDKVFPSAEDFLGLMQQAPFLQPWCDTIDTYFRYDMTEVAGGVRSRIQAAHIQEEMANKRRSGSAQHFGQVECPVLILRATEGIFSAQDILLPRAAVEQMILEFPNAWCVDLPGTNHYSIVFQPNPGRDKVILNFLAEAP